MSKPLFWFALIAFAVRGLVPAGWMPSGERAFAITVCNGVDTGTVWLDSKGEVHKQDPSKKVAPEDKSCGFAGLAMAAALPPPLAIPAAAFEPGDGPVLAYDHVAIGRGLAAPPPPQTGPPILI